MYFTIHVKTPKSKTYFQVQIYVTTIKIVKISQK